MGPAKSAQEIAVIVNALRRRKASVLATRVSPEKILQLKKLARRAHLSSFVCHLDGAKPIAYQRRGRAPLAGHVWQLRLVRQRKQW